ncbi:MAG: hypothetical protein ACI8QC_002306 [Planctomycetota bacterium]|jgi:hypothetical protein
MQTLTLLALSTLFLLPPQPVEETLAWNPAPSPTLRRTVNLESSTTVDESTLLLMGDERDAGSGMERTRDFRIVTLENYAASESAHPHRLVRVYESVRESKASEGAPADVHITGLGDETGLLEGLTVAFDYDAEEDTWAAAFADDSEGDEEWLALLKADMDCAAFLPSSAVKSGDSWDVELVAAHDLLWPGGEVLVESASDSDDGPEGGIRINMPRNADIRRLDELDGSLEATYTGSREVDGRMLAVIELELDLAGDLEVIDDLLAKSPGSDDEYSLADCSRELEGKGELLWDIKGGHLASLVFTVDFETSLDAAWSMPAGGMDLDLETSNTESGQLKLEINVERVE